VRRSGPFRALAALVAALLAMLLASCGTIGGTGDGGSRSTETSTSTPNDGEGAKKKIRIGWIPWDEDIVLSHLWKQVLEDKGYEVELVQLDAGPLFAGLAKGDIDVFLDGWLPITHQTYWEQYGDKLEDLGVWYDNAKLALTVPDYVQGIESIEDLKGKGSQFGGKIIGIEAGAGITRVTEQEALPGYGLEGEYQLTKSSTPAMLAELEKAVKAEKPVVVTLWRPHWAYASFPLRDLEDPKGAMGEVEEIHTIARAGFSEDFPEVAEWLSSFTMDDQALGELEDVALNQYKGKEAEGVSVWMEQNADLVASLTS
jgi:glycine betaine/proline transport system substrate-binding protein